MILHFVKLQTWDRPCSFTCLTTHPLLFLLKIQYVSLNTLFLSTWLHSSFSKYRNIQFWREKNVRFLVSNQYRPCFLFLFLFFFSLFFLFYAHLGYIFGGNIQIIICYWSLVLLRCSNTITSTYRVYLEIKEKWPITDPHMDH